MVGEIVAGLITSALTATAAVVWRYRARMLGPSRRVRVSFCALLRVRDDDRYVLFGTTYAVHQLPLGQGVRALVRPRRRP